MAAEQKIDPETHVRRIVVDIARRFPQPPLQVYHLERALASRADLRNAAAVILLAKFGEGGLNQGAFQATPTSPPSPTYTPDGSGHRIGAAPSGHSGHAAPSGSNSGESGRRTGAASSGHCDTAASPEPKGDGRGQNASAAPRGPNVVAAPSPHDRSVSRTMATVDERIARNRYVRFALSDGRDILDLHPRELPFYRKKTALDSAMLDGLIRHAAQWADSNLPIWKQIKHDDWQRIYDTAIEEARHVKA